MLFSEHAMLMCVCHADKCRHSCALERVGVVAQNFGECVRGGLLPTLACVWKSSPCTLSG